MRLRGDGWWWSGTAAGLAVAAVLVGHWRVPRETAMTGVDVRMSSAPTGELAVSPAGTFLTATGLMPGAEPGTGVVTIRNQTARRLAVTLRLSPSSPELDDAVEVRFVTPTERSEARPLRLLDGRQEPLLHLAPAEERAVTVIVAVPAGAKGAGGRAADVTVQLVSEVAA